MLNLDKLRTALTDKVALQEKLTAAETELTTLRADLKTAKASLASLAEKDAAQQAQIDEANTELEAAQGKVSSLEAEKKTVSQAAVEKLHELGVAAGDLPKGATPSGDDDGALYERYQTLKGAEKTAFLRTHRDALTRFAQRASEVI